MLSRYPLAPKALEALAAMPSSSSSSSSSRVLSTVLLVSLILLLSSNGVFVAAAAESFYVSEARGVDDASHNCSLAEPCRTLAFALTLPHQYGCSFYLFPETYSQPGNIGVTYSVIACTLSTYKGGGDGMAVFDCSGAGGAPCLGLTGEAVVEDIMFIGTVSESVIDIFPPVSHIGLSDLKFYQLRAVDPQQPPTIFKHLSSSTRVTVSSVIFEQCALQAILLDQYSLADFGNVYLLNNTAPQPGLSLVEIGAGARTTHSFNFRAGLWSGNVGWKSLIHYAPEAPRGMIYLTGSTWLDNQVSGSLVALEGAATICDLCEFARNTGEYSIHMARNDKSQLQSIQLSITKAVFSQTPPLRFYNATGSMSLAWDGRQHGATSREPVIMFEQPANMHIFESLFTNFVSTDSIDLPILSITLGGTPQTNLTHFFTRILMTNFTQNSGRIPLSINGKGSTVSSLLVNITSSIFGHNNNPSAYGGAIRITNAPLCTVNIQDTQFISNTADLGGAVFCSAIERLNSIAASDTSTTTTTLAPLVTFMGAVVFQNNQAGDDGPDVFVDVSEPCSVTCSGDVQPLCSGFLLNRQQYDQDRESGYAVAGAVIGVFLLVGLGTVGCFVAGIAFVRSVNRDSIA